MWQIQNLKFKNKKKKKKKRFKLDPSYFFIPNLTLANVPSNVEPPKFGTSSKVHDDGNTNFEFIVTIAPRCLCTSYLLGLAFKCCSCFAL
jgi:hypothetical protein